MGLIFLILISALLYAGKWGFAIGAAFFYLLMERM